MSKILAKDDCNQMNSVNLAEVDSSTGIKTSKLSEFSPNESSRFTVEE